MVGHRKEDTITLTKGMGDEDGKALHTQRLELPKVSGRLAAVLARAALEELNLATGDEVGQCAVWLAHILDCKQERDKEQGSANRTNH